MRWRGGRESDNVEDRRGMPGGPVMVGGLGTLLLIVLALVLGVDPQALLQGQPGGGPQLPGPAAGPDGAGPEQGGPEDELKQFVRVVLADTEDVWQKQFRELGRTYRDPTLVLFSGQVQSACGFADAAVGPFYCPPDQKVYLDLTFFQELAQRFRAPGEFAQAYVIAHEIGHHVQNQLGISDKVSSLRGRVSQSEYNQASVRLELQADFLAGMWAHHAHETRRILEAGDVEAALTAASAIGDDRLQRQTQGRVVPDSFTHGTSAQRVRWFRKGLQSGRLEDGDTFNAEEL
jgi:predicted metalloprotease